MMRRVVRTWARGAADFADVLGRRLPSARIECVRVAGGHLVLCGPEMYVNRALAAGLDAPLSAADFELIETRSAAHGVDASIEITPVTHPDVRVRAEQRGYTVARTVRAVRRSLRDLDRPPVDTSLVIEPATDQIAVWQETSALAWGHTTASARRASDAFAVAAAAIDGAGFVVARDAATGAPIGCASLTVQAPMATLTAMSTVPNARRRGVQSALIAHRLLLAHAARCLIATSTVEPEGSSERNLRRHGFAPWFDITMMTRPSAR